MRACLLHCDKAIRNTDLTEEATPHFQEDGLSCSFQLLLLWTAFRRNFSHNSIMQKNKSQKKDVAPFLLAPYGFSPLLCPRERSVVSRPSPYTVFPNCNLRRQRSLVVARWSSFPVGRSLALRTVT